jgi:hypothetical protein
MSYAGLEKTLVGRSCKLSRPTDFNDPLDMFLQEGLGMDDVEFLEELRTSLFEYLSNELDPASLRESEYKSMIVAINQMLKSAAPNVRLAIKRNFSKSPLKRFMTSPNLDYIPAKPCNK